MPFLCRPTNSVKALKAKIYSKARIYKSQYTLRYNILTVELQSESVAVAVVTIGQCISSLQPLIHSDTRALVLSPVRYSALDIVGLLLLLITNYFNVHREYSLCDWFCAYTISFFLYPAAKDIPVSSILPWHYPLIFRTAHSWTSQQFRLF